jgi:hypothetical protein
MPRRALRIGAVLAGLTTAMLLAGCAGSPYVDSRREAGKRINVGTSNASVVAICYGGGEPPPADVVKMAESECAKTGLVAQYQSRVRIACNLLAPSRAYFRCVKPAATENPK